MISSPGRLPIHDDWTETERRNVRTVYAYADAWTLPGGSAESMVDEIYAASPEVVSVLQGLRVSDSGGFKDAWKQAELRIERHYTERRILFDSICPCGDAVAFEGRVELLTKAGESRGWPFAVFMTFDANGRITSDHTYMPDSPHGDLFEEAARNKGGHSESTGADTGR